MCRCEQLSIDVADAEPLELPVLDEAEKLVRRSDLGLREAAEQPKDLLPLGQVTEGELTGDPGVPQHQSAAEQLGKAIIAGAEVIHPHRGVDEDHPELDLRLGGAVRFGSLAPRRARRRALSRWIRARKASRTRALFSSVPVRRWASARRSSSSAKVVRTEVLPEGTPTVIA